MRPELQLILASAPLHPSEAELQAIDALILVIEDWNRLALLLIDRGTAPLLYRKLPHLKNTELIPPQAQDLLRKGYYKTVSRNARIYEEFKALAQILQAQSIPFITLKGICMSEWLYGDTGLRQMSDIDIIIQEKDGVRCLAALHAVGYKSQQEFNINAFVDSKSHNHFNPLIRNHIVVEVHIRLQNTREIYQQNLKDVWGSVVPIILNSVDAFRLELSDMLIHACLHLDKHFVTTHVQFTSFNDIFNLLRMIDSRQQTTDDGKRLKSKESRLKIEEIEDFWERFEAKCIQYNFADTVFRYLVMVRYYYGAPMPDYLYTKYLPELTEDDKQRFINHLKGNGNKFIGRGPTHSTVNVHFLHLKKLYNPLDFTKYLMGVIFPNKAFIVSKYIESQEPREKNQDKAADISSNLHINSSKYFWLWYPYRWYSGIKGLFYIITKTNHVKKQK